jgi:hypothetical protein
MVFAVFNVISIIHRRHCIVGKNFGSSVASESKHFAYFYMYGVQHRLHLDVFPLVSYFDPLGGCHFFIRILSLFLIYGFDLRCILAVAKRLSSYGGPSHECAHVQT